MCAWLLFACPSLLWCAENPDCVSYVDLKKMPWLFKGKGDIQFDVYRDVKNETK